jgi:hypothetical protein
MKTCAEIRRLRLAQLRQETGLSYADMNEKLGRGRLDATLSQIAKQAPNTRSGKARQMGDDQARTIERAFDKPTGWMDRDPEFDELQRQLERSIREPVPAGYSAWPFKRLDAARVRALSPEAFGAVEDQLLVAVAMAERLAPVANDLPAKRQANARK